MVRTRLSIPLWGIAWSVAAIAAPASATDLFVSEIKVTQAVQFGDTPLVAGNVTYVRVRVGFSDDPGPIASVDALLRMTIDGEEQGPIFSLNGPIDAVASPSELSLSEWINFAFVGPEANDVDLLVELNPGFLVEETDYSNNTSSVSDLFFECRDIVDLTYVPIDYTAGAGLPEDELIEPGIGDGFVRAIFSAGEWNYHRSPVPPLVWSQNINVSSNQLLNALHDMRITTIPEAGYPEPPFVYGWLPGNPYSGNGKAIGIPGDVAFGNTQPIRHQRTFAHELGHLIGLVHTVNTINTVGIDTEHHLLDTENLPQTFPSSKFDVMVPGQLTDTAFVNKSTYMAALNDDRLACAGEQAAAPAGPMIRVGGVIEVETREIVEFLPIMRVERGDTTPSHRTGDLEIAAFDADGRPLMSVAIHTGTSCEHCNAAKTRDPESSFNALLPEIVGGREIARIDLVDRRTREVLGTRSRSQNAPEVGIANVQLLAPAPEAGGTFAGRARLSWTTLDADADPVSAMVHYSPDGGSSWLPVAVRTSGTSHEFDTAHLPSSRGGDGLFRVCVSDGFNCSSAVTEAMSVGLGSPPETYLISPNNQSLHEQHAPVILHGASWDTEDLMLDGGAISWSSDIDGPLGFGRFVTVDSLSPGIHNITVTGTDTDGLSSSRFVKIFIGERQLFSADLDHDGAVGGADLGILLGNWGNPGIGDFNFDGTVDGADLGQLLSDWG